MSYFGRPQGYIVGPNEASGPFGFFQTSVLAWALPSMIFYFFVFIFNCEFWTPPKKEWIKSDKFSVFDRE